jgi:hypothetical protein
MHDNFTNGTIPFTYTKFDKIVIEWMPSLMFSFLATVYLFAIIRVTQMHFSRTVI